MINEGKKSRCQEDKQKTTCHPAFIAGSHKNNWIATLISFARNDKAAFTLAEVLITLGIIGIVAAMTMPSLIQNYKDKQFKTAYKKAYADINAAFQFVILNDEYTIPARKDNSNQGQYSDTFFSDDANGFGNNLKTLSKYFKVIKSCYNNNAGECFVLNAECGRTNGAGNCPASSYAFIDASGRQWYMYANNESTIVVDTNGNKKPNKLGKDRFPLAFPIPTDTTGLYHTKMLIQPQFAPSYHYADISVDEKGDFITKQRWCPSGKCYYTSWLLE